MDNELNRAFQLVSQPDNSRIKEGEIILGSIKKQIMYPLSLLQFMNNASAGAEGHLRAAIELRIWCQNYNHMEEYEQRVYSDIMDTLKRDILIMFLESPLKISKTLRPGIVCIADVDFPDRWPTLLPTLLQQAQENPRSITAMLKLIQSISHKYSYLSRSDPLYHEIIIMCDTVHDFLLSLTVNLLQSLQDPPDDSSVKMLALLMSVFYNLNYQDLHPKFEDNLANWMQILKQIMSLKNTSESVFKCKGAALESILLYASKYKEDVEETIKSFCGEIWQLCASAT